MKLTRSIPAALVVSALALGACAPSDNDDGTPADPTTEASDAIDTESSTATAEVTDAPDTSDEATDASEVTDAPTDAPGDDVDSTDGPTDAPTGGAETASAVISSDEAQEIVEDLLITGAESLEVQGDEAEELRQEAFAGSELRAQRAARRIDRLGGGEPEFVFDPEADEPLVVAISRRELYGESVPFFIAQTVREDDVPVLHVVAQENEEDGYRIVWQAPMLPGTELEEFNALSIGSPVRDYSDGEGLTASPRGVMDTFVADLAYPEPEISGEIDDEAYIQEAQAEFVAQQEATANFAGFSQTHEVRQSDLRSLELTDGSIMVFGVAARDTEFDVLEGHQLNVPPFFEALSGTSVAYESAYVHTSVFVAFRVSDEDPAQMVAVREQIVEADGE